MADDVQLERLVAKAADGDIAALRALRDDVEPWVAKLVEDPRFLGRIGQREDDRSNIVFDVMALLESDGATRLKSYVELRRTIKELELKDWLRVTTHRVGIDYLRRRQRATTSPSSDHTPSSQGRGERSSMSSRVAAEMLRHAATVVREPELSALELWTQSASYRDIASELEIADGESGAQRVVSAAIDRLRRDFAQSAVASECRGLVALESQSLTAIGDHVASCAACRTVVELLHERRRALNARDRAFECARVELLIAASDKVALERPAAERIELHVLECNDCSAVMSALRPTTELDVSRDLPAVSTASYDLGKEVARGGMGRILSAHDLRIGRPVAVKEMLGKDPSVAARFEREARVTARLQHPGIVPIYEIGRWPDGTPFYTMRMVEGRTLRDSLREKTSLDERLALLPAVIAAADAVAFAHGKRIIHRDLTPNNILVGAYGETVVIDWGLAKDLATGADDQVTTDSGESKSDEPSGPGLTATGAVIGTAAYMPPEQAKGHAVDEAADVYALGAMLYHVLAGVAPYTGTSRAAVLAAVMAQQPRPISELAPKAPSDLITIVNKAMKATPSERYPTARQLADDLRRFQTGQLVGSHHYTMWQLVRRFLRRHRAAVSIAATLLAVLVVVLVVSVRNIVRARDVAKHEQGIAESQRAKAESEAERAHRAEEKVKAQLDQITAEQSARAKAETEARAKGTEVEMTKEQLADALAKAEQERAIAEKEKALAEQESKRARESEQHAEQAAAAEKKIRQDTEKLYEQEKARVRALEQAPAKGITTELKK